jgi:protein gp37
VRPRVFCASLADWLDDAVPAEWLRDLLYLWWRCRNLDFLALTKRPELWRKRLEMALVFSEKHDREFAVWLDDWLRGSPPENVYVGTTVENKDNKKRIPELLNIPARVRFLSCEPLLGPVNLLDYMHCGPLAKMGVPPVPDALRGACIHWVICGVGAGRGGGGR